MPAGGRSGLSKVIIYLSVSISSLFFIAFKHSIFITFWVASASVSSSIIELDISLLTPFPSHWLMALCSVTRTSKSLVFFFLCLIFFHCCDGFMYPWSPSFSLFVALLCAPLRPRPPPRSLEEWCVVLVEDCPYGSRVSTSKIALRLSGTGKDRVSRWGCYFFVVIPLKVLPLLLSLLLLIWAT